MTESLSQEWKGHAGPQLERALRPQNRGRAVVLDFDNTCILGDTGELFHLYLSEQMAWDLGVFVDAVAPEDGRARLRSLVEAQGLGEDRQASIFEELMLAFPRRLARAGAYDTYAWAARLQVGALVDTLRAHARTMLMQESMHPRRLQLFDFESDRLAIQRGIRSRPAFDALVASFDGAGITPWVITATNGWVVQEAARDFGIPPERVIGNNHRVHDGVVQADRITPVTIREGKAAAYRQWISSESPPALVVGDSRSDYELMLMADDAILIDRGDASLRERAHAHGWAVVPEEIFDVVPWGTLRAQADHSQS